MKYISEASQNREENQQQTQSTYDARGPFLETPGDFLGP